MKGDIKMRVEDYLALRRDSEALGRVNQELEWMNVFGLCIKGNGDTTSIKVGEELLQWHGKLKSAIADAGEEQS